MFEGQQITTKYPVLSYDDTTYIAIRDVAKIMSKDVNWNENENSIVFLSPMERAINNYDTGETIGKAIIKEFYNDKITENSIYRTDFCGRSLFLDDTFIEEVIFEPDKNINFDDLKANDGYDLEYQLYIANHCDVRVHISAIDGRIFIEERDKDNNMIEYSLFELSQKNKQ